MSVRLFESAGTPAEADFADEGVEFVTEEAGFHTVCFRNKGADEKVISFEIEMEDSLHLADPLDIMMGSTLHNIETILEDVTTVQKSKPYHIYREGRQRLGVKQVETSIMWYSLSLCCLIFLASLGQVVILKRWFRNKPVKSPW
ncbi:hypothetical protein Pelo_1746 [Pelomyxa schiedti]|nr:hypothetical protein Pelo_1746 [Pelomyxa schiedti]